MIKAASAQEPKCLLISAPMDSSEEIYQLTTGCASLFAKCQSKKITALTKDDWVGGTLADFNLWAAGIRASATGHSSLDYRVRDRPDVKLVLIGLLSTVKEAAERCLDYVPDSTSVSATLLKTPSPPAQQSSGEYSLLSDFSDDSTDTSTKPSRAANGPLETEKNEISTALNQLYRVTLPIQRSGRKYRFRKADSQLADHLGDEDLVDLRKHLEFLILLRQNTIRTEFWKHEDYKKLSEDVSRTSDLTAAHQMSIKANIVRRNRIRHATRHLVRQQKNTVSVLELTSHLLAQQGPQYVATGILDVNTKSEQQSKSEHPTSLQQGNEAPGRTRTQTYGHREGTSRLLAPSQAATSTEIGTIFMKGPRTAKAQGTTITRITRIGAKQDYPKCPKDRGMFTCPYCAQSLSPDYTEISKWRGHVKQDLMPYTCIFDDCEQPEELFQSSEEWKTHLSTEHSETHWVCSVCPTGSDPGPDDEVLFETKEDWKEHATSAHPSIFPLNQLEDLASMSEKTSLPSIPCPLCLHFDPSEADPYDHIASHIHEFALRALPWESHDRGSDDPDSADSDEAEGRRRFVAGSTVDEDSGDDDDVTVPASEKDKLSIRLAEVSTQITSILSNGGRLMRYETKLKRLAGVLDRMRELDFGTITTLRDNKSEDHVAGDNAGTKSDAESISAPQTEMNDRIDYYIRPMLRLHETIRRLEELGDQATEQEGIEAEESLQDEWTTLSQLLEKDNPLNPPPAPKEPRQPTGKLSSAPDPSPSATQENVSAVFVGNRAAEPDTASIKQIIYDPESESTRDLNRPFFEKTYLELDKFKQAHFRVLQQFDLERKPTACKPEDVEQRILELLHISKKDPRNVTREIQRYRSLFTGFATLASDDRAFLALLPDEEPATFICWGVQLVLSLITKTLLSRPSLSRKMANLLQAIVNVLTTKVLTIDPKSLRSRHGSFLRQIAEVSAAIFRLLTCLADFFSKYVRKPVSIVAFEEKMFGNIEPLAHEVRVSFSRLHVIATQAQFDARLDDQERSKDILNSLYTMLTSTNTFPSRISEKLESQREWLGQDHELMARDIWAIREKQMAADGKSNVLSAGEILDLGAPPDFVLEDCRRIIRSFHCRHDDTRGTIWLLNNKRLRYFFESRKASGILVRDDSRHRSGRLLSASFATAALVEFLRLATASNPQDHVLAVFCRTPDLKKHTRTERTMMLALLSQLMLQHGGLTSAILDDLNAPANLETASTSSLWRLFCRLVERLPSGSRVYCVIDSFDSTLMCDGARKGKADIVQRLLGLSARARGRPVKVLFTTSKANLGLAEHFRRSDVLDLEMVKKSTPPWTSGRAGRSQLGHTAVFKAIEAISGNPAL
ncbi:hypothetical protein F5B21DRAFT_454210 [Xylaria acuta]|nr:hypothetical protein F5B21DRAFT_454210 [Xylaria acuta]